MTGSAPERTSERVRRAASWTIADILDFESLVATKAEGASDGDRQRLAPSIEPLLTGDPHVDRRMVFKQWLDVRRSEGDTTHLGEYFTAGWQSLLTLAVLVGLAFGVSLSAGLLHYRGDEPVNVAWFFAWTVGAQLVLLALLFFVWLLRRTTHLFTDWHPLQWLLGLLLWGLSTGLRQLPGERRAAVHATISRLRRQGEIYRAVTVWPMLIVTQLFGVCFNIGVLGTLLLHVTLSDVAFGWQSTLRTSATDAHRIASAVATPWFFAPNAAPSLDQVIASRFAYSEGIRPLSPAAMASWWPWLCYAVLVYGLLVRLVLLSWASLRLREALRGVAFNHPAANTLYRQLTGPSIRSQSETAHLQIPTLTETPAPRQRSGSALTLIADDLKIDETELAKMLEARYGWTLRSAHAVQIDHPSGNAETLAQVRSAAGEVASVVVVIRARRSPIKAIALFLQTIAAAAGGGPEVLVLLLGRREETGFAEVGDEEFEHWRKFNAIHGLHLGMETWKAK
jgi:hypothetical protein